MHTIKLTVTLPKENFNRIERIKRELGISRSALVQKMVDFFFQKQTEEKKVKKYVDGYKRKPENIAEISALTSAQIQSLEEF